MQSIICQACHNFPHEPRELLGHEVRLMPAKDVKAYVKRIRRQPEIRIRSGAGAIL
jgi:hypothetical protein